LFLLPIVAGLLLLLNPPNSIQIAIATLSTLSAVAGVLTERWLFFAEAEHVVMVFYRGGSA
jgi:sulfite dehydrogenase (quinone) subunit SoeC